VVIAHNRSFFLSSFSLPLFVRAAFLCACVLKSTCHLLKCDFLLGGARADVRAGQSVGVGQWAAHGFCLCHTCGSCVLPSLRRSLSWVGARVARSGRVEVGGGLQSVVSDLLSPFCFPMEAWIYGSENCVRIMVAFYLRLRGSGGGGIWMRPLLLQRRIR
jgi:hypothetical protein